MNPEGQQQYWQHDDEDTESASMLPPLPESPDAPPPDGQDISWQASEYIHHEKHALWFAVLIAVALVLMAIAYFVIGSITFTILIGVMAAAVFVISSRPPRVLNYRLDYQSLSISEKQFSLHDFRTFRLIQDGPFYSIVLIPHKRFMPAVNVYFPPEEGERIVDIFGAVLPIEDAEPDLLDQLARKLRF